MPGSDTTTLLILGGTAEARALARDVVAKFGDGLRVITSLAGRTSKPAAPAGEVRSGGFGGAAALADYLRQESVDLLIDATHPFAAQISANAVEACDAVRVRRLVLRRPPWSQESGDRWIIVADMAEAAASPAARSPAPRRRRR